MYSPVLGTLVEHTVMGLPTHYEPYRRDQQHARPTSCLTSLHRQGGPVGVKALADPPAPPAHIESPRSPSPSPNVNCQPDLIASKVRTFTNSFHVSGRRAPSVALKMDWNTYRMVSGQSRNRRGTYRDIFWRHFDSHRVVV